MIGFGGCTYLMPSLPARTEEKVQNDSRQSRDPSVWNSSPRALPANESRLYRNRFVNSQTTPVSQQGNDFMTPAGQLIVREPNKTEVESLHILGKELEVKNTKISDLEEALKQSEREKQQLLNEHADFERRAIRAEQRMESMKLEILNREHMVSSKFPYFYEVQRGDSLWRIAGRDEIFKNSYKWIELYHANKGKISDPDVLYPGMIIKIPRIFDFLLVPSTSVDSSMTPDSMELISSEFKDSKAIDKRAEQNVPTEMRESLDDFL